MEMGRQSIVNLIPLPAFGDFAQSVKEKASFVL